MKKIVALFLSLILVVSTLGVEEASFATVHTTYEYHKLLVVGRVMTYTSMGSTEQKALINGAITNVTIGGTTPVINGASIKFPLPASNMEFVSIEEYHNDTNTGVSNFNFKGEDNEYFVSYPNELTTKLDFDLKYAPYRGGVTYKNVTFNNGYIQADYTVRLRGHDADYNYMNRLASGAITIDKLYAKFGDHKGSGSNYDVVLQQIEREGNYDAREGYMYVVPHVITVRIAKTVQDAVVPDNITKDFEPSSSGIIKADDRGAEKFDVTKGIPTSENLYVNVFGKNFLFANKFDKVSGTKTYPVEVSKTYYLSWEEDHGRWVSYTDEWEDANGVSHTRHYREWEEKWVHMSSVEVVSKTYNVKRDYSYWLANYLEIFKLSKAIVNNYALPNGSVTLTANGLTVPTPVYNHSTAEADHIGTPIPFSDSVEMPSSSLNGGRSGEPSVPSEPPNGASYAENAVGQVQVKNDKLDFGGTVMDDNWASKDAPVPSTLPSPTTIGNNVLYKNALNITPTKENKDSPSTGTIYYTKIANIEGANDTEMSYPIGGINNVITHTPVVCNAVVFNETGFNQRVTPDMSRSSIILDRPSYVEIKTFGQHNNILGYGNRDYRKYTAQKEVMWPFDVYVNTTFKEDGKYLKAGTWYNVPLDTDRVNFYTPTWVDEGNYNIQYRETAINGDNTDPSENLANFNRSNYVATGTMPVQVIGRLYDLRISDVNDYPMWQNVFRTGKNTTAHSSNYYWVGIRNQNGAIRGNPYKFSMPLVAGSHPTVKNAGVLKTGYSFRFDLKTIGNYFGANDCISIVPQFYFVKSDGTGRTPVDLYYNTYSGNENEYLIKIGSNTRNRNTSNLIKLGDIYRDVTADEINDTSSLLGVSANQFKGQTTHIGWSDWMILTQNVRTFIGDDNVPVGVDTVRAKKAMQKWYGEYHIPNDVHACPVGTDVVEYARTHRGIDFNEPFWYKKGYIIVNFRVEAVKNKVFNNPYLGYWNAPLCNMWNVEGFINPQNDYWGKTFNLLSGDTVFYDSDLKSSGDYKSTGTH